MTGRDLQRTFLSAMHFHPVPGMVRRPVKSLLIHAQEVEVALVKEEEEKEKKN